MIINHNITALNTHRQLGAANNAQTSSMEKLSSGLRINSAKDDAAGLSISEKMRGQIRGLEQASSNAQDSISLMQTAEGALNETHDILQRMREIAVQSSNDTNTADDRKALNDEVAQLKEEIDRISDQTTFNTQKLLDGNFGTKVDAAGSAVAAVTGVDAVQSGSLSAATYTISFDADSNQYQLKDKTADANLLAVADDVGAGETINFKSVDAQGASTGVTALTISTSKEAGDVYVAKSAVGDVVVEGDQNKFQIGANAGENISLSISDMSTTGLDITDVSVETFTGAQSAITSIDDAIKSVSSERSKLGAVQNRLEHTINNVNTSAENLTAAESRIRDVDYAEAA